MSDTTEGKVKILTAAVEALILGHPDRDQLRATFMTRINGTNIDGGAELFERIMKLISDPSSGPDV